jgi:predicted nucleic acid-binding protein
MIALDTNIWIYSHDTRDASKQAQAQSLIQQVQPSLALPWQIGCEFIAACRKLQPLGFSMQDAWDGLRDMQAMAAALLLPIPEIWRDAESLMARFGLSFWDALLAASCIRGGVTTLYSEDFGTLTSVDSLAIQKPFMP